MARRKSYSRRRPVSPLLVILGVAVVLALVWVATQKCSPQDREEQAEVPALQKEQTKGADGDALQQVKYAPALTSQVKDYHGFTVNFNARNGTPNYVAWELLADETDGPIARTNNFWQDPLVKGCPDKSDYSRSGYDRGHMFPAGEAKWNREVMEDCFVMTNMCPQAHSLNGGAWKTLEEKERLWAGRDGRLIVVAGPVYSDADRERIGEAGVRVPSAFFKVLLAPDIDEPRAIGFMYPNDHCPGNMKNYAMSVDEVEHKTGLDFFSALPDELENDIESKISFNAWNNPRR